MCKIALERFGVENLETVFPREYFSSGYLASSRGKLKETVNKE
jgi:hypothetical protein